jgi:hypothetical protein
MQVFWRNASLQREAGHLGQCMDACVSPSRTLGQRGFSSDAAQSRLQLALDGGFSWLHLPAPEVRAIVGQGEHPVLQIGNGLG